MSVIDTTTFSQLREATDPAFVAELVNTFLADAPQLLATLRAAAQSGDAEPFRRAAHTLKSNSNTFGATQLAAVARDMEQRGLAASGELEALERAYEAAAAALKELANG